MAIFYAPDILENPFLPEEEAAHCVRVLRAEVGDEVEICDGKGCFYRARVAEASAKRCAVELIERCPQPQRPFRLAVAVAPTKNLDRMEWLVEKLTEIGIDDIYFIEGRYSERRVLKTDRLKKIAVSAMKQSKRSTLPVLGELCSVRDFIARHTEGDRFMCHCYPEEEGGPRALLKEVCQGGRDTLVMIGPEGDFSLDEVRQALEAGFKTVSLGDARLRTETAAIVAGMAMEWANL